MLIFSVLVSGIFSLEGIFGVFLGCIRSGGVGWRGYEKSLAILSCGEIVVHSYFLIQFSNLPLVHLFLSIWYQSTILEDGKKRSPTCREFGSSSCRSPRGHGFPEGTTPIDQ